METFVDSVQKLGTQISQGLAGISIDEVSRSAKRNARLLSDNVYNGARTITEFFNDDDDATSRPSTRRTAREPRSRAGRSERLFSVPQTSRERDAKPNKINMADRRNRLLSLPCTSSFGASNGPRQQESINVVRRTNEGISAANPIYRPRSSDSDRRRRLSSVEYDSGFFSTLESIPEAEPDDKEGKLFVSAEYCSDDKKLFVFITQCGNITRLENSKKAYITFRQVYFGNEIKKKTKKIKYSRESDTFRYSHTYTVPFKTFDHMNYSGISILVKLKISEGFRKKETIRKIKIHLHDVEFEPVAREERLFF